MTEALPLALPVAARAILSVSQITEAIKDRLEKDFPAVWVRGEVSNFKIYASGHAYFTLKDAGAQMSAVFFRGDQRALKFQIIDGMSLLLFGRITVYESRGQYQIIVARAEPDGLGALQLAFEQLKKKLAAEGLFEASRKRSLPFFPRRVGIVTSPQGAAVRDMLKILRSRNSRVDVLIYPVRVQGEAAAGEIAQAIRYFSGCGLVDVVIAGRGGGSIEDLWAFNEETVARAVADCAVPVVSAVGHETDFTICDFVADVRAPTPTAAAQLVVPEWAVLAQTLDEISRRLVQEMRGLLGERYKDMRLLVHRLPTPRRLLDRIQLRLVDIQNRFAHMMERRLLTDRHRLATAEARLSLLSPLSVLQRGYAVVKDMQGHVLPSLQAAQGLPELSIQFRDGVLTVKR